MEDKSCEWPANNPLLIEYHDNEWGVQLHDDRKLFEFLVLDAFQAGLSWLIVLKKREALREAFDGFNPEKIALYDENKYNELINNQAIIRNKLKIKGTIENAKAFLKIREEYGSFDKFIWQFTDGKQILNKWTTSKEIPASTPLSDKMSAELKKYGFKFVGSTICYAFMQAIGMVNDHLVQCFRYENVQH
ncbi:MAG: DNA-3-methyladenine glycosylase [Bacteroidota bacterium]|nr:DNA-3-methyladenine glycosylase [Bacteroidota bacterium]